jgi:hypothetical protein
MEALKLAYDDDTRDAIAEQSSNRNVQTSGDSSDDSSEDELPLTRRRQTSPVVQKTAPESPITPPWKKTNGCLVPGCLLTYKHIGVCVMHVISNIRETRGKRKASDDDADVTASPIVSFKIKKKSKLTPTPTLTPMLGSKHPQEPKVRFLPSPVSPHVVQKPRVTFAKRIENVREFVVQKPAPKPAPMSNLAMDTPVRAVKDGHEMLETKKVVACANEFQGQIAPLLAYLGCCEYDEALKMCGPNGVPMTRMHEILDMKKIDLTAWRLSGLFGNHGTYLIAGQYGTEQRTVAVKDCSLIYYTSNQEQSRYPKTTLHDESIANDVLKPDERNRLAKNNECLDKIYRVYAIEKKGLFASVVAAASVSSPCIVPVSSSFSATSSPLAALPVAPEASALSPAASALSPAASALSPAASALPPAASALPPAASASSPPAVSASSPPAVSALSPAASALSPAASALSRAASALPPAASAASVVQTAAVPSIVCRNIASSAPFSLDVSLCGDMQPVPSAFKMHHKGEIPEWCKPIGVKRQSKKGKPPMDYLVFRCSICPDRCKMVNLEVNKLDGETWDTPPFTKKVKVAAREHATPYNLGETIRKDTKLRIDLHERARLSLSTPSVIASVPSVIASVPSVIASVPSVIASVPSVVASVPSVVASVPSVVASVPSVVASAPSVVASAPSVVAPLVPSVVASVPSVVASAPSVVASVPSVVASVPSVVASAPSVVASAPSVVAPLVPSVVASVPSVVAPLVATLAPPLVVETSPAPATEKLGMVLNDPYLAQYYNTMIKNGWDDVHYMKIMLEQDKNELEKQLSDIQMLPGHISKLFYLLRNL